MKFLIIILLLTTISCSKSGFVVRTPAQDTNQALTYLDNTMGDWLESAKVNGSPCLSCHTSVPYSMVRPAYGQSEELDKMRNVIEQRVKTWKAEGVSSQNLTAWYPEFQAKSMSTESVANAISMIYMDRGVAEGTEKLSQTTEDALEIMWSMQKNSGNMKGGFDWLDVFNLKPFEAAGGDYWGASMVAISVSEAPDDYLKRADIQDNIENLKGYLKNNFDSYTLHEKLMGVWADHELGGGVLSNSQIKTTLDQVMGLQKEGGWSIHKLLGASVDEVPDGYATGLVTNILLRTGRAETPQAKKGLKWIRSSQNLINTGVLPNGAPSCGSWLGASPNGNGQSQFFTDISTSYSMLTLQTASKLGL